ncbi:hypothetical protein D3C87_2085900 [compost metagenome]
MNLLQPSGRDEAVINMPRAHHRLVGGLGIGSLAAAAADPTPLSRHELIQRHGRLIISPQIGVFAKQLVDEP